ncbi:PAS domain-containing protein [Kineococcus sp. SYSU DK003]|uniref:PAS domain-containing protein n=1 Tax=Kineococcus sp. SYSU DK003 TaxID=3383124 RepID=UPI003D7C672B
MPPTVDPTLSIFTDAVLIDDERGRDQGLLVQGDDLTHEVLMQLLDRAGPSAWRLLPPALAAVLAARSGEITDLELNNSLSIGVEATTDLTDAGAGLTLLGGRPGRASVEPGCVHSGVLLDPDTGAWELQYRSRMLSWDAQCAALLDVHPVAGATLQDQLEHHVHPDDRDRIAEALTQACSTGQRYEQRYRTRMSDGSYAWRLSSGRVIASDTEGGPRIVGVIAALPS